MVKSPTVRADDEIEIEKFLDEFLKEHFTVIAVDPQFFCQALSHLQPAGTMLSRDGDNNLLHTFPSYHVFSCLAFCPSPQGALRASALTCARGLGRSYRFSRNCSSDSLVI